MHGIHRLYCAGNDKTSAKTTIIISEAILKTLQGQLRLHVGPRGAKHAHPREYFIAGFDSTTGERMDCRDQADAKASGAENLKLVGGTAICNNPGI